MKNQGFTLLEIIIVIIIIGVLTSLALPRLFAMVEGARATEAISAVSSIRASLERRYLMNNGSYGVGVALNTPSTNLLDIQDPGLSPGAHFRYTVLTQIINPDPSYLIIVTRTAVDNGDITQAILMSFNELFYGIMGVSGGGQDGNFHWGATDAYKNFIPKTP